MNKKKLPLRRKDRTATEQLNSQDENPVLKTKIKLDGGINEMNPIQNFEIPEFLKKGDNEQNFQSFLRMRQRHIQDGAISINIEADDIADQNIELYENKVINLELPNMNENLAKNKEYYVENTNRNQFHKISKIADEITKIENKPNQKKKVEKYKTGYHKEIERTTEDQIFSLFDEKLTEIILMTSNKVALLFLFTQGLLAGNLYK